MTLPHAILFSGRMKATFSFFGKKKSEAEEKNTLHKCIIWFIVLNNNNNNTGYLYCTLFPESSCHKVKINAEILCEKLQQTVQQTQR